ncbi:MAG: OmpH family outer membrane protein [Rhodothalassiaceae bacterium]
MKQLLFAIVFAALAAGPALAQKVPPARIILVDYDRVIKESEVGKNIYGQMQSFRIELERRRRELTEDLQAQAQELSNRANVVSQEVLQQQARELQQKEARAQKELQELARDGQLALEQANEEVRRTLRPIVKTIMEDRDATMVLDKAFVPQSIAGLDVTTEVIDQLNRAIDSFELALPSRS